MKKYSQELILIITYFSKVLSNPGDACTNQNNSECGDGECCGSAVPDAGSMAYSAMTICNDF